MLAAVWVLVGTAVAAEPAQRADAWQHVPEHPPHTDHSTFFKGPFKDGPAVTRACLECHPKAAEQVMQTAHWNWVGEEVMVPGHEQPTRIGKRNLINNFCIGIASNWPACTSCHIGYGWEDENFDHTDASLIDCLSCHDNSGTYKKAEEGAGRPDPGVDLLAAAKSVGLPQRSNCGSCHFMGGGANAVKHGDLDETLLFPSARIDHHMGALGFECIDCHQGEGHEIPGRLLTVSVDRKNRLHCTSCHQGQVHADQRLQQHTQRIACQTCHIPYMAVEEPTKMTWDWSEAGKDLGITDEHIYLKIKGRFTYARGIAPEYAWYNETSSRYLLGDKIDPSQPTDIAAPLGSRDDPESKIYPFKVHRGRQIYDTVHQHFILPNVHGDQGFWNRFDWPTAARVGSEVTGLPYSGQFDFAPTRMFLPQNHMVADKERALQCRDCHGESGRLDWVALGYDSDPLGRPAFTHEPIPLVDAEYESVFETGEPLSTAATCSQCHDIEEEAFIAKHAYHGTVDIDGLPAERRSLMQHGPRLPQVEGEQMNCFLCHLDRPNHAARQDALDSGEAQWSVTATLIGNGVVERTADGYAWNAEALDPDEMVSLGIGHVREAGCGACHGKVHDGSTPLLVDLGTGQQWLSEKTGQVFSPQRIRLSGMNLRNKDQLGQAWDVHAERLVQCGDCHYATDRPARLAGDVRPEAVAHLGEQRRRCDSCHSPSDSHDWLPEQQRHMQAVACESCHVPQLHMAAQQQIDDTVVRLDGRQQVLYRGVEGGRINRPAAAYITGYQPLLMVGETATGDAQVLPFNLVSRWYWVDGDSGAAVAAQTLRQAWSEGERYRDGILVAFDSNGDGELDDRELRLDDDTKVHKLREALRALGVGNPQIRGEVRSYHIHHNVTHGALVNRDCTTCHAEQDVPPRRFEVAGYLPGGVMPEPLGGEQVRYDGSWQVTTDGRLEFVLERGIGDSFGEAAGQEDKP